MEYLKTVFNKRHIKLLISAGITLLLGLLLVLIGVKVSGKLDDEQFVKRWCDDDSYAQVSLFLSEMADFSEDKVKELEYKINSKLTSDSISAKTEDSRLFLYAYSANGKVKAVSNNGSTDVKAIGVGGDFFLFHPLELVEGCFFDDNSVNKDLVVIDENTAWVLFGSNNVVGQTIEIGGAPHVISGVVKREEGRLNDLAGNNEPTLYLSYESLSKNGTVSYINCFEALMPNPLTGYALDAVTDLCPAEDNRFEAVENSGRFYWTKLIKNVKNFGTRGMNGKGLVYPYWENIARAVEDYLTPVCVLGVMLFSYSAVIVLLTLLRMWRKRTIHRGDVKDFVERKAEEIREKKHKKDEGEFYE